MRIDEICDRYYLNKKSESPKRPLRAFDKSFANTRKLRRLTSFYYVFRLFARSEASLFVFNPNSVSLLWYCFLCLSVLLEGTSLLLWWMPCCRNTKKSQQSPKAIPPDCQRKKSPPWSWKPPRNGLSKKDQKNMDDGSSTPMSPWCMPILFYLRIVIRHARAWFDKAGCCHFCGSCDKIVDEFPRRGYGRTNLAHQIT